MRKLSPILITSKPGSSVGLDGDPDPDPLGGLLGRAGGAVAATSAAIAKPSRRRPSPVAAEISKTWYPRASNSGLTASASSRAAGTSILFSAISRGR